jgi:hypothetical protein
LGSLDFFELRFHRVSKLRAQFDPALTKCAQKVSMARHVAFRAPMDVMIVAPAEGPAAL